MNVEPSIGAVSVNIREAKIKVLYFTLKKDKTPEVTVTLELLSVSGNKVAEVTLATDSWNDNTKLSELEIPHDVYESIGKIISLVSPICTRRINSIDRLIA